MHVVSVGVLPVSHVTLAQREIALPSEFAIGRAPSN